MSFAPWQLFCLWLYVLTVWMAAVLGHKMWWCICNGVWIRFCIHIFKQVFNTSRPRQNGRHFADDSFKWIFLNEKVWILTEVSLKFVPKGPINNIPALVQIMAWRRPGDKPLSEPMMVSLLTHICITRPQWVNTLRGSKQIVRHFADKTFKCNSLKQNLIIFTKKVFF